MRDATERKEGMRWIFLRKNGERIARAGSKRAER